MSAHPRVIPLGAELPPMEADGDAGPRSMQSRAPKRKPKHGDRFGVLNAFVDCGLAGLSRAELGTWLVLYRDTRDGTARTAAADIARRLGVSRRAVTTAIRKLTDAGLLTVIYRGGLHRGTSRYRVNPPSAGTRSEGRTGRAAGKLASRV